MRLATAAARALTAGAGASSSLRCCPRVARFSSCCHPRRLPHNGTRLPRRRLGSAAYYVPLQHGRRASTAPRNDASNKPRPEHDQASTLSSAPSPPSEHRLPSSTEPLSSDTTSAATEDWEENPNFNIQTFAELPHSNFGVNQHMIINDEFKEALRQILWQFRAPIRYAFAYGSGVFPQSAPNGRVPTDAEIRAIHPKAPLSVQRAQDGTPKMIDFIFGVTFTQHWHSLNLNQHRDHYSALGALGSGAVSYVQDSWGAGVYFNPYVVVNGILIKYGVVNLDTLCTDLSEWQTLYLAGRLHKPVKILRDEARVRLANQINLLSALRTALLLLPARFTEHELYHTIAAISYLGDPRMRLPAENPQKVVNIVDHNLTNFRRLYAPLIETLPNAAFDDPRCRAGRAGAWLDDADANLQLVQDMDPVKRANMVRRLPKAFRERLYFQYQKKFAIPRGEFERMMQASRDEDTPGGGFRRQQGGGFERRIVQEGAAELPTHVRHVIRQTINWPSTTQSLKGLLTSGIGRSRRYMGEKMSKWRAAKTERAAAAPRPDAPIVTELPPATPSEPTPSASKSSTDSEKSKSDPEKKA